jgi:hypothetical protein
LFVFLLACILLFKFQTFVTHSSIDFLVQILFAVSFLILDMQFPCTARITNRMNRTVGPPLPREVHLVSLIRRQDSIPKQCENASLHTRGCPGPILCIQLCFEIRASSFENCREHPGKSFLLIGKSFLFGNNSARASRLYTMDKRNVYPDYVIVYLG